MNAPRRKARPDSTTYTCSSDHLDGSASKEKASLKEESFFKRGKGLIDQFGKAAGKGIKISKSP